MQLRTPTMTAEAVSAEFNMPIGFVTSFVCVFLLIAWKVLKAASSTQSSLCLQASAGKKRNEWTERKSMMFTQVGSVSSSHLTEHSPHEE